MSKEWKCTDCVKYKTDACSTCACGYTPTVSCRDVLVDFDYAYEQGREDALNEKNCKECYSKCLDCDKRIKAYKEGKEEADQFLKQWKDDVMNSLCKYDANSVEEVYQLGIKRGRAEAIDKLEKLREFYRKEQDYDASYGIGIAIEQLKEQTNE